jgi:hypothetical protein
MAKGKLNYGRETGGKELKMVSIAEEKRRMRWSNIGFCFCLICLLIDCLVYVKESITTTNLLFAVTTSVFAAAAMYSKLRIEMLTSLGKSSRAAETGMDPASRDS